jgi:transposase
MRGGDRSEGGMWSYVMPEQRVPADHPLRPIRKMVNDVLQELSPSFSRLYSRRGRPSIPPEKLLRALLLQVLYSVRSERMLMEQLDYNLLFRWFVGLQMDDPVWNASTFSKNRDRLLTGDIADKFFEGVLARAQESELLSNEHFTVDGTLIDAWAGHKSFQPRRGRKDDPKDPGNPSVDFRGQRRSNETHVSTTDPDARLFRKSLGTESKLSFGAHVLMDNRHGLAVNCRLTPSGNRVERDAALEMIQEIPGNRRVTLGGDKGYDVREFVEQLRSLNVTPHIAPRPSRRSLVDGRTTRHAGYALSQRKRKRVEEIFGWLKTTGLLRKTRHRGLPRVGWMLTFALATYNLIRIRNLTWSPT